MKPSSRDSIIAGIERAYIVAGAKDYDSGMAQYGRLLERLLEYYHPMRSKKDLTVLLDAMPEPSSLKMRFILGAIQYMPQLLRYGAKRFAEMTEDFPEIPRGRPGIDAFLKAQIVAHVGKRHMTGYTLDRAKKSAALQFRLSESTIQRVWDDRGNPGVVDFRSVLKFLVEEENGRSNVLDSVDETQA